MTAGLQGLTQSHSPILLLAISNTSPFLTKGSTLPAIAIPWILIAPAQSVHFVGKIVKSELSVHLLRLCTSKTKLLAE